MIPALVLIGLAWLGVGAVLGERFAKEKGIKPAVGFGLGALLGPFAFVMKQMKGEGKICPRCIKRIPVEARSCPNCAREQTMFG